MEWKKAICYYLDYKTGNEVKMPSQPAKLLPAKMINNMNMRKDNYSKQLVIRRLANKELPKKPKYSVRCPERLRKRKSGHKKSGESETKRSRQSLGKT